MLDDFEKKDLYPIFCWSNSRGRVKLRAIFKRVIIACQHVHLTGELGRCVVNLYLVPWHVTAWWTQFSPVIELSK